MTRRIRDFMNNTNSGDVNTSDNNQLNESDINRNFGVPLDKCESSSISPVIEFTLFKLSFNNYFLIYLFKIVYTRSN